MNVKAVNVGCGTHVCELAGWENIDDSPSLWLSKHSLIRQLSSWTGMIPESVTSVPWPRCVKFHNAARSLLYPDSSLLYIYTSHFLQYLPQDTVQHFLRECLRVLADCGILRIVVPDLRLMCEQYIGGTLESPNADELDADRFVRHTGLVPNEAARRSWVRALRRLLGRGCHSWMYDEHSLIARVEAAGFRNVIRRGFGESQIPDVGSLEIPVHTSESLYVEGQKLECR
ncbi:MAG: hypothetical protein ABSF71_01900 [Terriglobia bacterium]